MEDQELKPGVYVEKEEKVVRTSKYGYFIQFDFA
jgi:hypothetical protein